MCRAGAVVDGRVGGERLEIGEDSAAADGGLGRSRCRRLGPGEVMSSGGLRLQCQLAVHHLLPPSPPPSPSCFRDEFSLLRAGVLFAQMPPYSTRPGTCPLVSASCRLIQTRRKLAAAHSQRATFHSTHLLQGVFCTLRHSSRLTELAFHSRDRQGPSDGRVYL